MNQFFIILITLFVISQSIETSNILEYQFDNSDVIKNFGSKFEDENTLFFKQIDIERISSLSGKSSTLNSNGMSHYHTIDPILNLKTSLVESKGFEFKTRIKIPKLYNEGGEFCIFCLFSQGISDKSKAHKCHQLDFGLVWQNRNLVFNLKRTQNADCLSTELTEFLNPSYENQILDISFRYNQTHRTFHINNKLIKIQIEKDSIYTRLRDVSTWNSTQELYIGPIKKGKQSASIMIFESSIRGNEDTQIVTTPVVKSNLISVPKKKFTISSTDCDPNDLECFKRTFIVTNDKKEDQNCLSRENTCSMNMITSPLDAKSIQEFMNTKIQFMTSALIPFGRSHETYLNNRQILQDSLRREENLNSSQTQCVDKTMELTRVSTLYNYQLGDVYLPLLEYNSSFTYELESLKKSLSSLNPYLQISVNGIYKTKCHLGFLSSDSSPNVMNEKPSQSLQTSGNVMIRSTLKTIELKEKRRVFGSDLYLTFQTSFPRYTFGAKHLNQPTEPLEKIGENGTPTELIHAEFPFQCDSYSQNECSYEWSIKTTGNVLRRKFLIHSNGYLRQKMLEGFEISEHLIFYDITFNYQEPIRKKELAQYYGKSTLAPQTIKLCLYSDEKLTKPFVKKQYGQLVYFKFQVVYDTENSEFSCDVKDRCFADDTSLLLKSFSVCTPRTNVNPSISTFSSCQENNGIVYPLFEIINSNDVKIYEDWKLKFTNIYTNCSSIVTGSYEDQLSQSIVYFDSNAAVIKRPPLTKYGANANFKLASHQLAFASNLKDASIHYLGNVLKNFVNPCTDIQYYLLGYCYDISSIMGIFIQFIPILCLFGFVCLISYVIVHLLSYNNKNEVIKKIKRNKKKNSTGFLPIAQEESSSDSE